MTEDEWLAGEVPFEEVLRDRRFALSERKRRLFLCACLRQAWLFLEEHSRNAVEVAERFADGLAVGQECDRAWSRCSELRFLGVGSPADRVAEIAAGDRSGLSVDRLTMACRLVVDALVLDADCKVACGLLSPDLDAKLFERLRAAQEALFRDVAGNPFRLPPIEPAWLTSNDALAPRLARQLYDERRWSELPVLGDALEDAGCDDDDVLDHCHGPGPHVRGCWVLDLVLGRE